MYRPLRVRLALGATALAVATLVATLAAQSAKPTGAGMADAADAFLAGLTPDQAKQATFDFDDPHRTKWYFTPVQDKQKNSTRKGLRMDKLDAKQKEAALGLLRSGLSGKGYEQATTIMSLENLLAEFEGPTGGITRDPQWYFVSVFGTPSKTGKWGWRIEGHHLSVNFTLDKGEVVAVSPIVFGSNPAEVKNGARKGLKPIPDTETPAKELIASLTPEQDKTAKQAKQLPEIKEGRPDAAVGEPVGIAAKNLTDAQRRTLMTIVTNYAKRLPDDLAAAELKRLADAGEGNLHFAYCVEADKPGKPYTYRVHGPTFVIEFLNVQADSAKNPANHIHSGWRALPADFATK